MGMYLCMYLYLEVSVSRRLVGRGLVSVSVRTLYTNTRAHLGYKALRTFWALFSTREPLTALSVTAMSFSSSLRLGVLSRQ